MLSIGAGGFLSARADFAELAPGIRGLLFKHFVLHRRGARGPSCWVQQPDHLQETSRKLVFLLCGKVSEIMENVLVRRILHWCWILYRIIKIRVEIYK